MARDYFLVQPRAGRSVRPVRDRPLRQPRAAVPRPGDRQHVPDAAAARAPLPPRAAAARPTDPPQSSRSGLGQFVVADVYRGLEPAVARGTVKYLRVCQEVRSDLEQLPNGEYRKDHEPFQDFYAAPTHMVSGPYGWPSYVAKASLGTGAGRRGRLGQLLRPGRQGAVLPGARRELQRGAADAERGAVAAGREAELHRLPRGPRIGPAGSPGDRPAARAAAGSSRRRGAPGRSPTRRSCSRCGTPSACGATTPRTSRSST